jgi:hypothetical protein
MDFESINISLNEARSLSFFPGQHAEAPFISLVFGDETTTFLENIFFKISDHQKLIEHRELLGDILFIDKYNKKLTVRITNKTNENLLVIPNLSFKDIDYNRFVELYKKGTEVILTLSNYVSGNKITIRSPRGKPELQFSDCIIQ